jgi:hypothetical protein
VKSLDVEETPGMPEPSLLFMKQSDNLLGLVYHMFHLQQMAHGYYNPTREGSLHKCPEGLVVMSQTASKTENSLMLLSQH